MKSCSVAAAREKADVDLKVVAEGEADFVLSLGDELVDERKCGYMLDCGTDDIGLAGWAGNEEVEIAYGLASSTERAGRGNFVDAGKDSNFSLKFYLKFGVNLPDLFDVCESSFVVESVGHGEVFAVVGDGDVGQATGQGGFGHLADGVASVGGFGVHMEVAADVGKGDEVGQGMGGGGFELAGVLAKLGWNVVEVEGVVDVSFAGRGDDDVIFNAE